MYEKKKFKKKTIKKFKNKKPYLKQKKKTKVS